MSAFIVDKTDIDTLVSAAASVIGHDSGMRWWDCDAVALRNDGQGWEVHTRKISYTHDERCDEVGRMLWAENLNSIEYRYPDTVENHDYPGHCDFDGAATIADYQFTMSRIADPIAVLHVIDSYEYQSCEHPSWPASEAASFCDALRGKMIRKLYAREAVQS